jgi:hypothetical protein
VTLRAQTEERLAAAGIGPGDRGLDRVRAWNLRVTYARSAVMTAAGMQAYGWPSCPVHGQPRG